MTTLTTQEFEKWQVYIETECGISLGVDKIYLVESRLKGLMSEYHANSFDELFAQTQGAHKAKFRQQVIDAITTNETLWFRDKAPYEVFRKQVLPAFKELVRKGKPKIRIWSAACSTGQEPYSLSMVIHDYCEKEGAGVINTGHFEILATDISSQALAVARVGAYDKFTMGRGMEDAYMNRYFKQNQNFWIIDPAIKRMVQYQDFNLQDNFTPLGMFDVVFMRNVAIYFSHEAKVRLFEKVRRQLYPHGLLFIGSTESLSYYTQAYVAIEFEKTVYYQSGTNAV